MKEGMGKCRVVQTWGVLLTLAAFSGCIFGFVEPALAIGKSDEAVKIKKPRYSSPKKKKAIKSKRSKDLRPSWHQHITRPTSLDMNQEILTSYLEVPAAGLAADNNFIDRSTNNALKIQYDEMMRRYEIQRPLTKHMADQYAYRTQVGNFSRYMTRTVLKAKFDDSLKEAKKNSKEIETFHEVNQQVNQAAKGKMQVDVAPNMKIRTRLNIPEQRAGVYVNTPILDTKVDYYMGEDPTDLNRVLDPTHGFERYRLGVGKGIKKIGLHTGLTYGGSSTRMSASMSKAILAGLACEVSSTWGVNDQRAGLSGTEETVKLKYGIRF